MQSKIVYFERQRARLKNIERKQDTRRKIQLGGLVKKAELDHEAMAVILGLLLDAAEKLQSEDSEKIRQEWKIKGDLALTKEQGT